MTTLVERRQPFNPLQRTFWNDLFDRDLGIPNWFRDGEVLPAVNIKEDETHFELEFAVPGYKKGDFNINIENNVLTVKAEVKDEHEERKNGYARHEFSYRSFERNFNLPENINDERVLGRYENGILHVTLPKMTKELTTARRKSISVL